MLRGHKIHKINILIAFLIIFTIGVVTISFYRDYRIDKVNASKAKIVNKQLKVKEIRDEKIEKKNFPYENKNWLAVGDSITHYNKYQRIVAKLCKIDTVSTDAIYGEQLGQMADTLTKKNLSNVDIVTVFGGTNDYGKNKLLGNIRDDKNIDTFYGNIKNVIDKISTLNHKSKIVFITPLKRGIFSNQPVYPNSNKVGFSLEQYVDAIKIVCADKSIQVIDLFNESGINENNLLEYTLDNLHPNSAGYYKISKIIADKLDSYNK